MNVLVTGGAGYLGSIFVPFLLNEGHHVTVLDNFMYKQDSALDDHKDLEIVRGDVREERLIKDLTGKADAIFPLACLTGAPICEKKPKEAEEIIIDAIRTMLKLRSPNQFIIYPTTNSGYGVGEKSKFCTEKTPLRPVSLYGRLKVKAEEMILNAQNSITLRLATAFGMSPRMRLDLLVNDFVYHAVTHQPVKLFESHFMRNYVHVKDIADVFLYCLKNFDDMKNETYNTGLSEANLSKRELCEEIKKQVSDFKFSESNEGEDPDQRDYIVSNERIEKKGFKAKVSLSDGIKELIEGLSTIDTRHSQLTNI